MNFQGFSAKDFDVFYIQGLDSRMNEIRQNIQPKFAELGKYFTPHLSVLTQQEIYYHIAKHARRTVNPPDVTWVAWSTSKKGYKSHPHFQVGLWSTHLFVWFALIYEAPNKGDFARHLEKKMDEVYKAIPKHFVWSMDHTQPDVVSHQDLTKEELFNMTERLKKIKKAEILCGIKIERNDPILHDTKKLLETIEQTFDILKPLYQLAVEK